MQNISRRTLIGAPLGLFGLPLLSPVLAQSPGEKPHFFLQILVRDGLDSTYLMDSRPKSFTAAGHMANYSSREAVLWEGMNGGTCLASAQANAALKPFKSRLAVINGVHMPPGFDGHDQNINALLTNNPFGGKYVGSKLPLSPAPFNRVEIGNFSGLHIASDEQTLNIDPGTAAALNAQIKSLDTKGELKPWQLRMQKRAERCGQGTSLMAQGCASYAEGLRKAKPLHKILADATPDFSNQLSSLEKAVHLAQTYFKAGLSRAALVSTRDYVFDAHFVGDAQSSEAIFREFLSDLSAVLKSLENTAFDEAAGLSMLDVTTVIVCSEFGRTHGQVGRPIFDTGTDHNTLANSALLLGKGIKGDQVVGATDLDHLDADGRISSVSKAHLSQDPKLLKKMGKPFDFSKQESLGDLPETYRSDDYITSATLVNTLLSNFGVKRDGWLLNSGLDAEPAKILSRVLQ